MKLLNRPVITNVIFILSVLIPGFAHAQDVPQQVTSCVACHGEGGISNNKDWPNLAGQNDIYLIDQLKAYKEGSRQNELMNGLLSDFTDEDIKVIADYYSQQPLPVVANGDAELVETGHQRAAYCVSCHGMWGKPANPEWPILAGQQAGYLYKQLMAFKSGQRYSPMMKGAIEHLSEDDFAALAAYYSQLTGK